MELTGQNYFSQEADEAYMSVSQYKTFAGATGRRGFKGCEAMAMAKIKGEYKTEPTKSMLIGSYVDAWYEGTLDTFKKEHPQIFKKDGTLYADYVQADKIIERSQKDKMFRGFMAGDKQVIMTGHLFGCDWKIKMDSYIEGRAIVDLKVMEDIYEKDKFEPKSEWTRDLGYIPWFQYWGYDIQGAIYQEIVFQNTGDRLPFFIAGCDKKKPTGIGIFHLDDQMLRMALSEVEYNMPRILDVKSGLAEPDRCECCDYCRETYEIKNIIEVYAGYEGKKKG